MAKNTPTNDDEIDLVELIQAFLSHKTKYIFLGIVGLVIGLTYTFQHEPRFETKFKFHIGHPAFDNEMLIFSSHVQLNLNESELNPKLFPNYSYDKKTKLFSVVTIKKDSSKDITKFLNDALANEIAIITETAKSNTGFDRAMVLLNEPELIMSNDDYAQLEPSKVIESLKISYSKVNVLYPHPLKHGVIGIFIGLVLAFLWMMADIVVRQLKKK